MPRQQPRSRSPDAGRGASRSVREGQPQQKTSEECWTDVRRRDRRQTRVAVPALAASDDWALRQADWIAPVVCLSNLPEALATFIAHDTPRLVVSVQSEEDEDAAIIMLRAFERRAALIVRPTSRGSVLVPGLRAGRLSLQRVVLRTEAAPSTIQAPELRQRARAPVRPSIAKTTVMRAVVLERFVSLSRGFQGGVEPTSGLFASFGHVGAGCAYCGHH